MPGFFASSPSADGNLESVLLEPSTEQSSRLLNGLSTGFSPLPALQVPPSSAVTSDADDLERHGQSLIDQVLSTTQQLPVPPASSESLGLPQMNPLGMGALDQDPQVRSSRAPPRD